MRLMDKNNVVNKVILVLSFELDLLIHSHVRREFD